MLCRLNRHICSRIDVPSEPAPLKKHREKNHKAFVFKLPSYNLYHAHPDWRLERWVCSRPVENESKVETNLLKIWRPKHGSAKNSQGDHGHKARDFVP